MTIRIAVYGTGYLGATHATGMAELGHDVLGVDVDVAKLAKLEAGEVPFFEPELEEALQRNIAAGKLRFTSSFEQAAAFADAHFIAVGTPQKRGEFAADMQVYRRRHRDLGAAVDRTDGDLRQIHGARGHREATQGSCARAGARR